MNYTVLYSFATTFSWYTKRRGGGGGGVVVEVTIEENNY